ncbi:MAG: SDR family oxidoreductase [Janthinobacterium lividum]
MKVRLKPLAQQVVLITGASSGLGLTTARKAARAGASVMLVSRNEDALKEISHALNEEGFDTAYAVADVANKPQLEAAAVHAVKRFGRIDTWVNNAGVSIYGHLTEVPVEDHRQLFETNYWGIVNGSLIAVEHLRENGGAIINLGSELSDVVVPLQGTYCASKHAVKGFTDGLRIELAQAGLPISVTLIKPAGMDTLFVQHAKNFLDFQPKLPMPVYAPDLGADAILHAAQKRTRDIYVGGASKATVEMNRAAPKLVDFALRILGTRIQKSGRLPTDRDHHALNAPGGMAGYERSGLNGHVFESSPYTRASISPTTRWLAGGVAVLSVGMMLANRNKK